jgi:hypothetical protein
MKKKSARKKSARRSGVAKLGRSMLRPYMVGDVDEL